MTANQITVYIVLGLAALGVAALIVRRLKRPPPPPQEHRPHSVGHGYDKADMARSKLHGLGNDGPSA